MTGASPEILSLKMKGFALVIKNFRAYGVCMGHRMWCKMATFSFFLRSKSIIRISYIFSLVLALVEAKEKYAEWRTAQENKAEQDLQKMSKKPAPYKHIKVVISANCQL